MKKLLRVDLMRGVTSLDAIAVVFLIVFTSLLGIETLDFFHQDLSVPLFYNSGDAAWQLSLTKLLRDTGWILTNPFLGAPGVGNLHQNSAAQTSPLHSVIMLAMSYFISDAVKVQQIYYLANFPLIALTSFLTCRFLKINAVVAAAIGTIFAFGTFRFNYIIYAFLPNYSAVPLAILPVIWVGLGIFSHSETVVGNLDPRNGKDLKARRSFPLWQFLGGLLCVLLVTTSDGYYAFFTLLLLGVATAIRVLSGDLHRPSSLAAPLAFIALLIGTSFLLALPLEHYKANNPQEFFVDGAVDPALIKHPFESEVYSSSLKLLLSPIANHRIPFLGKIGHKIIETSEAARKYQLGDHSGVQLGTLGSLIFVAVLIYLITPALRMQGHVNQGLRWLSNDKLTNLLVSLILFVFLCSILGGIGSIIGLVFPTIRAYSRFPIFLIFLLLLLAGHVTTRLITRTSPIRRKWILACVVLVAGFSLYDETPRVTDNIDKTKLQLFVAERNFVHDVEAALPPGAMVYQYPYSDYLLLSKYYGWGSFAGQRLYVHSKLLHWSGGAAKNSYVENWDLRIAELPISEMLNEIEAVGFAGMVIDRTVVGDAEFAKLTREFASRNIKVSEDPKSHLAFARLNENGFRFEYEPNYIDAARLVITDRKNFNFSTLPDLVNRRALSGFLSRQPIDQQKFDLDRASHPDLFLNGLAQIQGGGELPLRTDAAMIGTMNCSVTRANDDGTGIISIELQNQSDFDWRLGVGKYPIRVGLHIVDADGRLLRWDDGTRVPTVATDRNAESETQIIRAGSSKKFDFPVARLNLTELPPTKGNLSAVLQVVQDGNAWFKNISCQVPLVN